MISSRPTPAGKAATISRAASTGVTGSSSPTQTSVGLLDPAKLADDIEATHQVHAAPAELRVPDPAGELIGVRHARPEGGEHAVPFGVGDGLAAVVAPGQLGDLVAAEAAGSRRPAAPDRSGPSSIAG